MKRYPRATCDPWNLFKKEKKGGIKTKNRVIALIMVSVLLFSSISLALSLASRSKPEAQEQSSIPPEAFEGLGGKKGIGFGDWRLYSEYPSLTIFSYPAGSVVDRERDDLAPSAYYPRLPGWEGYLVDMLMTITVTMDHSDGQFITRQVDVTFHYLQEFWNETGIPDPRPPYGYIKFWGVTKAQTTMRIGLGWNMPQSTTFTGQIYLVTLTFVDIEGNAGGHYFVSADRRV